MTQSGPYGSPTAFRRALTDKLKALVTESVWSLAQLQRQIAYDRLLERLYMVDDGWIVKGAVALLARDLGVRASNDVDVYHPGDTAFVEAELRRAAALDIGDWFHFGVGPRQAVSDAATGVRLPIDALIGGTEWARFHVDLVGADIRMTGQVDDVPPLARVAMPAVEQSGYRAYPLVDHIADKVVATFDGYGHAKQNPSTRFRDLVDLVAISLGATIAADDQIAALQSEAQRRGVTLPATFDTPDRTLWVPGYAAEARKSLLPIAHTLDDALDVVRPFLDPLLAGTARGTWDKDSRRWAA